MSSLSQNNKRTKNLPFWAFLKNQWWNTWVLEKTLPFDWRIQTRRKSWKCKQNGEVNIISPTNLKVVKQKRTKWLTLITTSKQKHFANSSLRSVIIYEDWFSYFTYFIMLSLLQYNKMSELCFNQCVSCGPELVWNKSFIIYVFLLGLGLWNWFISWKRGALC